MSTEPLEKDIQRAICEYLEFKKYFFWRSNNIPVFGENNAGHRTFRALPKYTPRGLPDIILVHKGKFVAIEVKRPSAKLRPEQEEFALRCITNGVEYWKVTSLGELLANLLKFNEKNNI
jgi:hypothetical protein